MEHSSPTLLEVHDLYKAYGSQVVLEGLSLSLPRRGLVCVLGRSGCGKTTLLNILGGLDHDYTGTLTFDGGDTSGFGEREWDRYRGVEVGFVFQEPHLIDYLTVCENVRCALTFSREVADEEAEVTGVLKACGIEELAARKPDELSGGQAQRVAVARALVKDPRVVLADEPTGSLDVASGRRVMELLAQVADQRLVVVVTHDRELARAYATRIVELSDEGDAKGEVAASPSGGGEGSDEHGPQTGVPAGRNPSARRQRLPRLLALARRHFRESRRRSAVTVAVCCLGIVGTVLLLAVQTGARGYMNRVSASSLIEAPLTIEADGNAAAMAQAVSSVGGTIAGTEDGNTPDSVGIDAIGEKVLGAALAGKSNADLDAWWRANDSSDSEVWRDSFDVQRRYDFPLDLYTQSGKCIVHAGEATIFDDLDLTSAFRPRALAAIEDALPDPADLTGEFVYNEKSGTTPYELLAGRYPSAYDEAVVVCDRGGRVSDYFAYATGLLSTDKLRQEASDVLAGKLKSLPENDAPLSFDDLLGTEFSAVVPASLWRREGSGWEDASEDATYVAGVLAHATKLRVVGVVRPSSQIGNATETGKLCYTPQLVEHLAQEAASSDIVREQRQNPSLDVRSGRAFSEESWGSGGSVDSDELKQRALALMDPAAFSRTKRDFVANLNAEQVQALVAAFPDRLSDDGSIVASSREISQLAQMSDDAFEAAVERYAPADLNGAYRSVVEGLGAIDLSEPYEIDIYPASLEGRSRIAASIDAYNQQLTSADANATPLSYENYGQGWISQVEVVVSTITYVLVALVVIALALSAFMIFSVTSVAATERRREIGILRAMGATRGDVTLMFDAENAIVGVVSGVLGSLIAAVAQYPTSAAVRTLTSQTGLVRVAPASIAPIILAGTALAVLAGHIPARGAARQDPARV